MSLILKTICSYIPRLMDFINCLLYHYFLPVLLFFFLGDVCSLHQMFMGFFFRFLSSFMEATDSIVPNLMFE